MRKPLLKHGNLQSQIQRDAKEVFLNLDEFAVLEHIRYFHNGANKPPLDLRIPIVVNEDANMNSVWNKNKNQQRIGADQTLFQMTVVFFCAREDFDPPPKKGRRLKIGERNGHAYEVLGADIQGGLLKIELRELDE